MSTGRKNYCFTDLPPHEQVLCNAYLKGGIDSIGLIEIDAAIASYSSEANWNTAIAAGKARVIKGIKCEFFYARFHTVLWYTWIYR